MIPKDLPICKSYIDGKMFKRLEPKKCLKLVHIDKYGTFSVYAWREHEYFVTFNDEYSRFGYAHRKSNVLDTLIEFKARSNNHWAYIPNHFN